MDYLYAEELEWAWNVRPPRLRLPSAELRWNDMAVSNLPQPQEVQDVSTLMDKKAWAKFKPRKGVVQAYRNDGTTPEQINTEHGTEDANPGMYVVQVGTITRTRFVPAKDGKPGGYVATEEPKYEVMLAEDFESLYEPA